MVEVDLKTIKTEGLLPNEIESLFIPTETFNTIIARNSVFIVGPKGSGKSMILNYLSFPVQIERFKNSSLIPFDTNNMGIYIRCNEHSFGPEKSDLTESGPTEYWKRRFTHFINLTICEKVIGHFLVKDLKLINISDDEEKEVCMELLDLFDLDTERSFKSLHKVLRHEIRALTRDRMDQSIPESHFTDVQLLTQFQTMLQQNIESFNEKNLVILLDEYQELSSNQQNIFSEMISIRKPIFKIASLPIGLGIARENEDQSIDLNQDFQIVNLHTCNITPDTEEIMDLKKFLTNMANKRLKTLRSRVEDLLKETEKSNQDKLLEKFIDYSGLGNFVLLSSGNPKDFLDLLSITISKWQDGIIPISPEIQNDAILEFARKQLETIDYIPAISPFLMNSVVQKIGKLLKNYLKETRKNYLQIGIKDPEDLSVDSQEIIKTALKFSFLMKPCNERVSRDGNKLFSLTLKNSLLPLFDLPIKSHQVKELNAMEFEKLLNTKSTIDGIQIRLNEIEGEHKNEIESLDKYSGVIDEIVDHIRNRRCVLFIGSGLSGDAGYPTGKNLAKKIANKYGIPPTEEDISIIAEKITTTGRQVGDLIRFIKALFGNTDRSVPNYFDLLVELGIKTIFTTNWDSLLEEAHLKNKIKFEKIVRDATIPFVDNESVLIYKLHGDFDNYDQFIIKEEDVLNIQTSRPVIMAELHSAFLHNHFLFIGYGMGDLDFKIVRNIISKQQGKFAFTAYSTAVNLSKEDENLMNSKGIIPLKLKAKELIEELHKSYKKKGNR